MNALDVDFRNQRFGNGYQLVDGVAMHAANSDNFHIPPPVIKRHVICGMFVELRIDSPRFSAHEDALETCTCEVCNGEATKPILGHAHPETLVSMPKEETRSRGWGEDFWVLISDREDDYFRGVADNHLVETRLHGIEYKQSLTFHSRHILAVHGVHRQEMVAGMGEQDLRELVDWLGTQK